MLLGMMNSGRGLMAAAGVDSQVAAAEAEAASVALVAEALAAVVPVEAGNIMSTELQGSKSRSRTESLYFESSARAYCTKV